MKRYLTLLSACAVSFLAHAVPLTPQDALQRAMVNPGDARKSKALSFSGLSLAKTGLTVAGDPAYYIFSNSSTALIISADDIAKPVLGYTDTPIKEIDSLPPAMKWWLDMYAGEVAWAASKTFSAGSLNGNISKMALPLEKKDGRRKVSSERRVIAPMVSTEWDQTEPFNNYCPGINGEKTVTGCVATSMAQVMNYHQWPQNVVSGISYQWNGETLSSPPVAISWDDMLDSYMDSYSAAQGDAVARLMQLAGYSVNMKYGLSEDGGSGAYSKDIRKALVEKFGYDIGIDYLFRDYFTAEEWKQIIYDNLKETGPVIYGGSGELGGHSFVCDGFDGDDSFHINWGWSGIGDGYYTLSALNPSVLGTGGGGGGFNYNQDAVLGIRKPTSNSTAPLPYFIYNGNLKGKVSGKELSLEVEDGGFYNLGCVSGYFSIGVILINEETGARKEIYAGESDFEPLVGISRYSVDIESDVQNGLYRVYPSYKIETGGWEKMRCKEGCVDSFLISVDSSGIMISDTNEPGEIILESWNSPTGFISGAPYTGYLEVVNTFSTPQPYSIDAYLCVIEDGSYHIVQELGSNSTTIPAKSSANMEFSGVLDNLTPDIYYLVFGRDMKVVGSLEVEVLAKGSDWQSIGEGTFREFIFSSCYYAFEAYQFPCRIERSIENPENYRIPDLYKEFVREYGKGNGYIVDTSETSYLYINTFERDGKTYWYLPEDSNLGFTVDEEATGIPGGKAYLHFNMSHRIESDGLEETFNNYPDLFGTFENGVFTIGSTFKNISGDTYPCLYWSTTGMEERQGVSCNTKNQFAIALPGQELPSYNVFSRLNPIGECEMQNCILENVFGGSANPLGKVFVYEDPRKRGYLHIENAYLSGGWNNELQAQTTDLEIDLSDPEFGRMVHQTTNYEDNTYGEIEITSISQYYTYYAGESECLSKDEFLANPETRDKNIYIDKDTKRIVIPSSAIIYIMPYRDWTIWGSDDGMETWIQLPKDYIIPGSGDDIQSWIENAVISVDSGETRYYNLQGLEIKNPQPGQIVIVKRGDKTSKIIVQ